MDKEVEVRLKTNKAECGCGCGIFGTLRVKPWRSNSIVCVQRGCSCRQCVAGRSSRGGYKDQKYKGAKKLAGVAGKQHEQHDRFTFRWENKRDGRVAGPVFTAFEAMQKVDNQLRPIGDNRPFIFRAGKTGARYGLVVFRDDQLEDVWRAIGTQNNWL